METDEQKENAGKKQDPAEVDPDKGDQSETLKVIIDANAAAERLEKANKVAAEHLGRQDEILAREAVAGRAEGGRKAVKESEDEKYKKEAKVRYEGTGMDPTEDEAEGPVKYS